MSSWKKYTIRFRENPFILTLLLLFNEKNQCFLKKGLFPKYRIHIFNFFYFEKLFWINFLRQHGESDEFHKILGVSQPFKYET